MTSIQQQLFDLQDTGYRDFQAKLIPDIAPEKMIGVRTPALRDLAKKLRGTPEAEAFLADLPHAYFDEDQLHAFLLSAERSFEKCLRQAEAFLPYVNNWATCDQFSPKVFGKHTEELLPCIKKWLASEKTYTIRFSIGMLMQHYLDEKFDPSYPEMVAAIRSDEYYVNMMVAWYFATALAKQYDAVIPYIENRRLGVWTHNKAIQKCVESRRIPPERKEYLRSLKARSTHDGRSPVRQEMPSQDPPSSVSPDRIRRISYYEKTLTDAENALRNGAAPGSDPALTERIRELAAYYESPAWRKDFDADEAGLIPKDLKRGVLSEDGIYNILTAWADTFPERSGE